MVEQSGSKPQPLSHTDIHRQFDGQWVLVRIADPKKFDPYPDGFVVTHGEEREVLAALPTTRTPGDEYTVLRAHRNFVKPTYEPAPELPPHLR